MVLNKITFVKPVEHGTADVTAYVVGIFPFGESAPVAVREFPAAAAVDDPAGFGQAQIDLTSWGNENPVPEGSYQFRVKSKGPEGSESPWGDPTTAFDLTNLTPPLAVSVE